jgi:acyl-CoA dehydrogenase
VSTLAYQRATLSIWALASSLFLVIMTLISESSTLTLIVAWLLFLAIFVPLYARDWRRKILITRLLKFYRKVMPSMSRTEREALAAGSVSWEGDLFQGSPHWEKLLQLPPATLSAEEQAFLAGPVEVLCGMIQDWDITHNRADLPPHIWTFLKENGFFLLLFLRSTVEKHSQLMRIHKF